MVKKPLFTLGQVVATPGALELLEDNDVPPSTLLDRHVSGDWGKFTHYDETVLTENEMQRGSEATADDSKLNKWGVDTADGRILSSYSVGRGEVWIITEWDRSVTTFLLPIEY